MRAAATRAAPPPGNARSRYYAEVVLDLPAGSMVLTVISDGDALTGVRFGPAPDHPTWLAGVEPAGEAAGDAAAVLHLAVEQLGEYAAGAREAFDLPLAPAGTPFQGAVWEQLRTIPYGRTSTYGAVAAALGRPGHARAVGAAVGANPIGIVIPCHRVVGASGALTGFAGGLDNKIALLTLEGITGL